MVDSTAANVSPEQKTEFRIYPYVDSIPSLPPEEMWGCKCSLCFWGYFGFQVAEPKHAPPQWGIPAFFALWKHDFETNSRISLCMDKTLIWSTLLWLFSVIPGVYSSVLRKDWNYLVPAAAALGSRLLRPGKWLKEGKRLLSPYVSFGHVKNRLY